MRKWKRKVKYIIVRYHKDASNDEIENELNDEPNPKFPEIADLRRSEHELSSKFEQISWSSCR